MEGEIVDASETATVAAAKMPPSAGIMRPPRPHLVRGGNGSLPARGHDFDASLRQGQGHFTLAGL